MSEVKTECHCATTSKKKTQVFQVFAMFHLKETKLDWNLIKSNLYTNKINI